MTQIIPVQQPIRRVPWHTRQKVKQELKRLMKLDIVEKVNEPTTWVNPYVVVPRKSSNQIRRKPTEAVIRERHYPEI